MKAIPSSPTGWPGSASNATAATGSQSTAASVENSQTNVAPPAAVFARTFQAAWASAASTTSARTKVDIEGLLSDGPRRGQDGSSLRAFVPSGLGRPEPGAVLSSLGRGPPGPHCLWHAPRAARARAGAEP